MCPCIKLHKYIMGSQIHFQGKSDRTTEINCNMNANLGTKFWPQMTDIDKFVGRKLQVQEYTVLCKYLTHLIDKWPSSHFTRR